MAKVMIYSNELYHHGILGMKWGLRRYQNPDGSLTEEGKKRYNKVLTNDRLRKKQTKQAINIYSKNKKDADNLANSYRRLAYNSKSKFECDNKMKLAKEYEKKSDILRKRISDIEKEKLVAGRDFIVQKDFNLYVPIIGGVLGAGVTSGALTAKNLRNTNLNERSSVSVLGTLAIGASGNDRKVIYKDNKKAL